MRSFIRQSATRILAAAVTLVLMGTAHQGFAQHFDVFVTSQDSKLVIGGFDDGVGTAIVPEGQMRVFGGEVVPTNDPPTLPFQSESPGEPAFRTQNKAFLDGSNMDPSGVFTALTGSTALTFNFQPITIGADTRNLFFWDGNGPVSFGTVPSTVSLDLDKFGAGGWRVGIDGSTNSVEPGNIISTTSSDGGGVHDHLFTSIGKNGGAPDQGFYLFSLQMEMNGFTSSDPLFFVFGALDPADFTPQELEDYELTHDVAIDWVQVNLVPEPSTCMILALGAAAIPLVRRRLRRR